MKAWETHKPAGLYPNETKEVPAQILEVLVESGAVHSRSQGFLPTVVLRLKDDQGKSYVGYLRADEGSAAKIATDIMECIQASHRDLQAMLDSMNPGTGKSHGKR